MLNPPARGGRKFIREGRCTQEQGVWATLWPPLSLASIGAVLEKDGHRVRIVDCPAQGVSLEDVKPIISETNPRMVVWSTGTPSIDNDLELASAVKRLQPGAVTAVIGTHVTVLDCESLQAAPDLDVVIRNEPELTVRELVHVIESDGEKQYVAGISYRDGSGAIRRNPARPFIDDLDSLPFPAWHLLDIAVYRLPLKGRPFLMVAPLRGCPYHCSFCTCHTYYGSRLRLRSVEGVLEEIDYDCRRFGIRDFFFWAETFVVNRNYVQEICQGILERGLHISWTANSRVDTVDQELLYLMARAGCWMLSFGIESASQAVLDEAKKGSRVADTREAVRAARKAGIKTVGHFILGLPGETAETLEQTIALATSLKLDLAQFYCAVPFPGSRLYERALQEGWIDRSDFSRFNQNSALMHLPGLSPEEVNRCRLRAYKRFYTRPLSVIRAGRLVNWTDVRGLVRSLSSFLRWMVQREPRPDRAFPGDTGNSPT